MQETWVRSLGGEDPLEKEMATHSNILAGKIPWQRSLVVYSPWVAKSQTWLSVRACAHAHALTHTHTHTHTHANTRVSHPCHFPSLVTGLYMSVLSVNLHIPQQSRLCCFMHLSDKCSIIVIQINLGSNPCTIFLYL